MIRKQSKRRKQRHHGGRQSRGIPPKPAHTKPAKSRSSQQDKIKDDEFLDYMARETQLLRKAYKEVLENFKRLNLDPYAIGGPDEEAFKPLYDLVIKKAEETCEVAKEIAQLLELAEQDAQRRQESQQK